jgi:hypothetical protein
MDRNERNANRSNEADSLANDERSARPANQQPRRPEGLSARDIEAFETDGKGTGGMGADLGGHSPLPED